MSHERIEVNYQTLDDVRRLFDDESQRIETLIQQVEQRADALRDGGWQSPGSGAFYAEMDEDILPRMRRLQDSLQQAADVTRQIQNVFEDAESQAGMLLNAGRIQHMPAPSGKPISDRPATLPPPGELEDGGMYGEDGRSYAGQPDLVFVPGIRTNAEDMPGYFDTINDMYGGEFAPGQIAGIFNKSDGGFFDVLQAFGDSASASFGLPTLNPATHQLMDVIIDDIENGDGQLTLVAHSQGGAITASALQILHNQGYDLSGITVDTYGSYGRVFPPGPNYTHYMHQSDFIRTAGAVTQLKFGVSSMNFFENLELYPGEGNPVDTHSLAEYADTRRGIEQGIVREIPQFMGIPL